MSVRSDCTEEWLRCPNCGYVVICTEVHLARYSFQCPRCKKHTFDQFVLDEQKSVSGAKKEIV